tara:strand:- start:137 stop:775 length:639 start_codon:yes stop_codon:yes gene_type:complete
MFDYNKYREILSFLKKNTEFCQIIAISKNHPKESIVEAINHGVYIFGENRVMEAKNKFFEIKKQNPKIKLHLTGPLQSNKVKLASQIFDVFHTLDREKIAKEFHKNIDFVKDKEIFIQVNTGKEKTKSGIYPKEVNDFKNYCKNDIGLKIVGLMCIPPFNEEPKEHFKLLQELAKKNNLEKLSIGMSGDYKEAINFNPSYIRLGTILFGTRN